MGKRQAIATTVGRSISFLLERREVMAKTTPCRLMSSRGRQEPFGFVAREATGISPASSLSRPRRKECALFDHPETELARCLRWIEAFPAWARLLPTQGCR